MNGRQPVPGTGSGKQAGVALLTAMLTVTLVASLAAAAAWQQWRDVALEAAERARAQAAWILVGAQDWSRLVLREDARAGGLADHLAEPWSVPLQEARLSTFLAAENNVAQADDASTDMADAFLSGQISDLQARLNLANLVQPDGEIAPADFRRFSRLFERLGLPAPALNQLVEGVRQAQAPDDRDGDNAPLQPPTPASLGWLGLPPFTVAALAPHVAWLPERTPVNLNTAGPEVLYATLDGLDAAGIQTLLRAREARHFRSLQDVKDLLGPQRTLDPNLHGVGSSYFEVRGRLRLDGTLVEERSIVRRRGGEVLPLLRERGGPTLPMAPSSPQRP